MLPPPPAALHLATASLAPVASLAALGTTPLAAVPFASSFLAPLASTPLAAAPGASALAFLRHLAQASLMGTLFVLAVWLLCRLAPRLPAGLRCALWWLACLKLLLGLAWPAPLALPPLPPAAAAAAGWLAPPAHAREPLRATRLADAVSAAAGATGAARLSDAAAAGAGAPRAARIAHVAPAAAGAPRTARLADALPAAGAAGTTRATVPPPAAGRPFGPVPAALAPSPAAPWWALALLGLWLAGVLRQAVGTARELRRVRGFLARSAPVRDAAVLQLAADLGSALGLAPVELRAAPAWAGLTAPLTAGVLRPVVALPAAGLERLSRQELAMTLAYELMHVRRRDLLWGWIPATAARLFFFLPPAALAAREYGLAREAACDSAVLRLLDATPASYGRLLLRLGVRGPIRPRSSSLVDLAVSAVNAAGTSAATVGGAAASLHQLKRRLEMLQHHQHDIPPRPARLRRLGISLLALVALAALVPLRIVTAAAATAASPSVAATPATPATPAVAAIPARAVAPAVAAIPAVASIPAVAAVPAVIATPAVVTTPVDATPPAPAARTLLASLERPSAAATAGEPSDPDDADDRAEAAAAERAERPERRHGDSYVLLGGDSHVTMSGDAASIERARKLQREAGGGDLLWVRRGGKEYVIRDAATLHEVREIFRPQEELGARQGKLGAQQGELGARQGELGSRQGELGAQQGKLGAEQGRLAAEQAKLAAEEAAAGDHQSAARDKRHDEFEKRQEELAGEMRRLGEQQRELGRQQRELGEPQRRLGDQQRDLGRQQRAAAREAETKLHALLDRAVARGIAQEPK